MSATAGVGWRNNQQWHAIHFTRETSNLGEGLTRTRRGHSDVIALRMEQTRSRAIQDACTHSIRHAGRRKLVATRIKDRTLEHWMVWTTATPCAGSRTSA
eukprot:scaffold38010_cov34-Tisochrysis_lutea.AAC.1